MDHAQRFAEVPPPGAYAPDQLIAELGEGLVLRRASAANAGDFTLVEDTRQGRLASTLCLLSHRLSMAGIEFEVGRTVSPGNAAATALVETLFPSQASCVLLTE